MVRLRNLASLRRSCSQKREGATITLESKEQLQELYGTKTYEAANAILSQP
jgi:hypothetical protein